MPHTHIQPYRWSLKDTKCIPKKDKFPPQPRKGEFWMCHYTIPDGEARVLEL